MKRFYDKVTVSPVDAGFQVLLDERPIRTPARALLILPSQKLAEAIADEWRAQTDKVDPRTMPVTGLSNAAIDRIATDIPRFAASIAAFGESDLLAYRADGPRPLVERQSSLWDPIVAWACARYDISFTTTTGIIHQPQPEKTLERLRQSVAVLTPFQLAALNGLVTISGSLIIGLALIENAISVETAWQAGHVDELWQEEQWGEDELALRARTVRLHDFEQAARFLTLLPSVQ